MSSINTNAGAMTALQTLKATNKNLETTQGRISTGARVSEAAHNAAYWSIATTMRSDNNAMSTVKDALGLGAAQVDIAYTAMDAVKDTLDTMKSKLVAAQQPDIDKEKIQEEINQLQNDLKTYAKSATFSGGNWLDVDETSEQKIVASFIRDGNAVSLETITVDTAKTALFTTAENGLLQGVGARAAEAAVGTEGDEDYVPAVEEIEAFNITDIDITADGVDLAHLLSTVDEVLSTVTTAASDLGAIKTRISSQQDFVGKIMDAVDRGVGQLVDADMEQESSRLQALQVQQQLGIQALSIANSNTQNILSLFR